MVCHEHALRWSGRIAPVRSPTPRSDVMTVSPTWHRRALLCALALVCWGGLAAPATGAPTATPAPSAAAAVTFSDDFDGPAGAAADPAKWQTETGDNVSNHERQY